MEGFQDLDRATLVQMVGRAGRPGHDSQGVAVIMTEQGFEANFYDLANGLVEVKSRLAADKAREALNAEICRGAVASVAQAEHWWRHSFAYSQDPTTSCREHLGALEQMQCAKISRPTDRIDKTATGLIASTHHLALTTVAQFASFVQDGESGLLSVLKAIAHAADFDSLCPRRDQKRFLNSIGWALGRFKTAKSVRVVTANDKTLCLFQTALGQIAVADAQLRQEMGFCLERGQRGFFSIFCRVDNTID